ncbi:MAG: LLM class flavin-dependent oxidoreductase [Hydrogenophilales bacterium]|nr:LLM class flavin-dependent oxidoreductase [Hydrogenophilales bacterium]
MRFDLFHELSMPPQLARTESQAVADWLDEMALADRLGFGCGWLVEHHFMRGYSHSSKPEILLAAAAARTQRLRLGLGVIPAPYHHPVHIAEKVAMLDVLSNGRLEVGIGRGFSPKEFQVFGADMAASRALTQEALDVLRLSFTRSPMNFRGAQIEILPHVVQQPHPPLWSAAVSPAGFEWSARNGLGVLAGPFKPWFMTQADIRRYQASWTDAAPLRIGMTLGIVCLPDAKRAQALAKPAFEWFYRALYQSTLPVLEKLYPSYEAFAELGKFRQLLALGINAKLLQTFGMAVAGSPEQCIEALSKYRAAGVTHILLAAGAGALPTEVVRESMQCIAQDVMPAFQDSKA